MAELHSLNAELAPLLSNHIWTKRSPNLFLIGAMKSGTTSLHGYLESSPDFYVPAKGASAKVVLPKNSRFDYFVRSRFIGALKSKGPSQLVLLANRILGGCQYI